MGSLSVRGQEESVGSISGRGQEECVGSLSGRGQEGSVGSLSERGRKESVGDSVGMVRRVWGRSVGERLQKCEITCWLRDIRKCKIIIGWH